MPTTDFRSELTLPSHPGATVIAGAYTREIATLARLAAADTDAFVDAVTTACADIVQNALTPGEPDALTLAGVVTASTLTLRRIGLDGIVGYPVTTHVFSQRMEESIGAHLCGVALAQIPRSTTFKEIAAEPLPQRVSTMFYFKYMAPPRPTRVHAPPHHRPMLNRVYAALAVPVEFGEPAAPSGQGHVTASLDRSWGFGEIHVHAIGDDTAAEIRRARRDLCETGGVEVVYLFLPLAQPAATPALCAAAEAEGFFWSGVGPRYATDGDALCLQYLNVDLDLGLVQVASPPGRELLDYVAA